jgi:hypothetical protein
MIESVPGGALRTWRIDQLPQPAQVEIMAFRLADHRAAYLEYEGAVSNGRGSVRRVDAGTALVTPVGKRTIVRLSGGAIIGKYELIERDNDALGPSATLQP